MPHRAHARHGKGIRSPAHASLGVPCLQPLCQWSADLEHARAVAQHAAAVGAGLRLRRCKNSRREAAVRAAAATEAAAAASKVSSAANRPAAVRAVVGAVHRNVSGFMLVD
eukprot:151325-Chlamydomonas_euryale.AAC.23